MSLLSALNDAAPELPEIELPEWMPGSGPFNRWFRWPDDVPRPRLTPSNWVKFSIDEGLVNTMALTGRLRVPSARMQRRVRDEVGDALELFASRGWLADPESYHRTPPPLRDPVIEDRSSFGLRYEHLTFESAFAPEVGVPGRARWLGYENSRTAHAWLLRHDGVARPWVVCVHGYRMGDPRSDLGAVRARELHEERGLNVLAYVLPLHGPRSQGRSGDRLLAPGFVNLIHGASQAVWDLRRLLGWLREEQGAPAIGAYGLSLGGYTVSLLASLTDELDCVIAGIPAVDFVRTVRRLSPRFVLYFVETMGMSWHGVDRITRVVNPLALRPRVPVDRRYLFAGVLDRLVSPAQVRDLWEHWERPRIAWYQGSHLSFNFEPEVHELLDEALANLG